MQMTVKRFDISGEHYEVFGDNNGEYVLHSDYEELEAQVKQLAAENAALKSYAEFYSSGFRPAKGTFGLEWKPTEKLLDDCGNIASDALKTPTTDAAIASLRAEGVEMVLGLISHTKGMLYADSVKATLSDVADQLRCQSAPSHASHAPLSAAINDIIAERQRQQSVEGWTPEHDDKYQNHELIWAATTYACNTINPYGRIPFDWPWDAAWWKPTNPRRDLVKAAALIAAEIERIDRAARQAEQVKGVQS